MRERAAEIVHGDCLDVMATLEAESVSAIVTDPPYGLAFMGHAWDHGVPGVPFWTEALRVAKPGAHLVAFGGTRTFHRLASAIEDAGWEVRDGLLWLYGSGFPKSRDVSKAIDDAGGAPLAWRAFARAYAKAVEASGLRHADIDRVLGIQSSSCYWVREDHRGGMPPRRHWEKLRTLLALGDEFEALYCNAERRDRVVSEYANNSVHSPTVRVLNAGTPVTSAAKEWQGWGTALKPAWEPIILARKLPAGGLAASVVEHGTGALHIEACRLSARGAAQKQGAYRADTPATVAPARDAGKEYAATLGRWPTNVLLDESAAELVDAQAGAARGVSRFFYTAKASRSERGVVNTHPTVKPTALMRWLVRLVTPRGGLVLDPFCGSGSTGIAAFREGARFLGIEREAEYVEIARARLAAEAPLFAQDGAA